MTIGPNLVDKSATLLFWREKIKKRVWPALRDARLKALAANTTEKKMQTHRSFSEQKR